MKVRMVRVGLLALTGCALACGSARESGGPWASTAEAVHTDLRVGIGTSQPQAELAVNGNVVAKEIKVSVEGWPDYVFRDDYALMPLDELENRLEADRHLPGIPDASEIEREGVSLGAAQRQLLVKVEELTLYVLELKRTNDALAARISELERAGARQ